MALYNRYDDLSPMERVRLANEQYRRMAYKNITEQSRRIEEQNKDPEYEGKIVKDNATDISSELEIINSAFRSLISNIPKIKDFLVTGTLTNRNNFMFNFQTINIYTYDKFVELIGKIISNLDLITEYTRELLKIIRDEGEENFNYSLLNKTYTLFDKFKSELTKHYALFKGLVWFDNAINELLFQSYDILSRAIDGKQYLLDFYAKTREVINYYHAIKQLAKEYGKNKITEEPVYTYNLYKPPVGPATVRPPAQRQYGATSAVKGSGKNRQLPWWLWM